MKITAVKAKIGLSVSTIYRLIATGEFPPPIKLGESASGWLENELDAWIAAQRERRDTALRREVTRKAQQNAEDVNRVSASPTQVEEASA